MGPGDWITHLNTPVKSLTADSLTGCHPGPARVSKSRIVSVEQLTFRKDRGQYVTFTTPNMRIEASPFGFIAEGFYLNLLFYEWKGTYQSWFQDHV
jgi:hypothetical protein